MRLRYRIPLAIIAFLFVMTMFLGSSYAYWQTTATQTNPNVIHTGCFEITFEEKSSNINLTNAYPIPDEKGLRTVPYEFTVTNNCDIDATYDIYLNTLKVTGTDDNKIMPDEYIMYSIGKTNGSLEVAQQLSAKGLKDASTQGIVNNETSSFDYDNAEINKSYKIISGESLEGKKGDTVQSKTYDLRLWIKADATKEQVAGKKFNAAISTIATATDLNKG